MTVPVPPIDFTAEAPAVPEKPVPVIADDAMERTVLGNILVDCTRLRTNAPFEDAAHLKAEAFDTKQGRYVYRVMERLHSRGVQIDLAMVRNELKDVSTDKVRAYEDVGEVYLRDLMLAEGGNTQAHINVLAFNLLRREGDRLAQTIQKAVRNTARELSDTAQEIETVFADYVERVHMLSGRLGVPLGDSIARTMKTIHSDLASDVKAMGIQTQYAALNALIGGFRRGLLYFVAGRPGKGKTAFMLNLAMDANKQGNRVLFITLEQSIEELTDRMLAIESGLDGMAIINRELSLDDLTLLDEAAAKLQKYHEANAFTILALDEPTMGELFAALKAHQFNPGFDIVFMDYLGPTMVHNDTKLDVRQFLGRAAGKLKKYLKKLHVPLVSGAQLNRAADNSERPELQHLAESAGIEHAADVVMLMYRDDRVKLVNGLRPAEVIVAKHRNGPIGTAPMDYRKACMRFLPASSRTRMGSES